MGSGKSLAGRKMAALAGLAFIDLDVYIERQTHKSVQQIFDNSGERAFRAMESEALTQVLALPPAVIALGGGTVCFNNNLQLAKQAGCLVYIQLPALALANRLKKSKNKRPLLKNTAEEELPKKIESLLAERKKFYEQAHITVNGLNLTPQSLYNQVLEFQKSHSS